jgi:hypothetical protein
MALRSLRLGALVVALLGDTARAADNPVPLDENTALMVGDKTLKIGVLSFAYGITRQLEVGSNPIAWFSGSFTPVFAPNVYLKYAFVDTEHFVLSGQAALYYAQARSASEASGHLWEVPLSLYASQLVLPRLWVHGEFNYNWVRAVGAGDLEHVQIHGGLATRSGQLGLMFQWRLSRVVSLLARGRVQAWSTPMVLHGTGQPDAYTNVEVGAEVRTDRPHPWLAVAGVALTWSHVGLIAGGGYGQFFVPGANLVVPGRGFVPEGSLWVNF